MNLDEWLKIDLNELSSLTGSMDEKQLEDLCQHILAAKRIFVVGKGRTGLVMEMFAMRLMQMGRTAFVAGASTTPAIRGGDLLVAGSGSGETAGVVSSAKKAAKEKAKLAVITSQPESTLAKMADSLVILPGGVSKLNVDQESKIPLGSVLEQSLLVVLDGVSAYLAKELHQTNRTMMDRHANLE